MKREENVYLHYMYNL